MSLLVALLLVGSGAVAAQAEAAPAAADVTWLCRPGMVDPCDLPNDRTDVGTGKSHPATSVPESAKKADCFYVYPTVTDQPAMNADRVASPTVQSIARFQAAPFNGLCRVFAPVYRQMTLWGLTPAIAGSLVGARDAADLAYGDVLRAWRKYLREENHGRPVVFIGHSQGTLILRKLIRDEVDPNPELRKQMAGAFLMGGNTLTARGAATGGDFREIPLCTRPGQAGCVVAYSTELVGLPSLFGNAGLDVLSGLLGLPSGPTRQVACTDPFVLSGDRRPVGATVPSRPYAASMIGFLMAVSTFPGELPTSSSTWTTGPGRWAGKCVNPNGFHRLHVRPVKTQHFNELPLFDSHLVDMNLGIDRLVSIARSQIAASGA